MRARLHRFLRCENGAALVEFGLLLPSLLVVLALSVEGGRIFWSYQTTITGVRDAARYLSRVVDADICASGGGVSEWNDTLTAIVRDTLDGDSLFPPGVTIDRVSASLTCNAGDYRGGEAGVATVVADLTVAVPFAGLFTLVGASAETVRTSVTDQARVIGL